MNTINALPTNYLVNSNGERLAVIIPVARYEEMLDAAEELEDLADIDARENEPTISHEEVVNRMRANGRL